MKLPKLIKPDPIASASFEVRFSSTSINNENLLQTFYPVLINKFNKFTEQRLPVELNVNPQFAFLSQYIFSNDNFSIGIAPNSFTVNNNGNYHLWDEFYKAIRESLHILNELKIVNKIDRLGLRYINVLKDRSGIEKHLNINAGFGYKNYSTYTQQSNTIYRSGNIQLVLNLAADAIAHNPITNVTLKGLFIDIDSSTTDVNGTVFDEVIFRTIDLLHTEEKTLFFSVLKEEFLTTLNPEYDL